MIDPEILFGHAARSLCHDLAEEVVHEIKFGGLTPVETGALLEGYHVEDSERGSYLAPGVDYWADVEYGHDVVNKDGQTVGHAEAQPHVRPALEVVRARHEL